MTQVPRVPLPKPVQTAQFLVRPIGFIERSRRSLGETFHASFFGPGEVVFISDPPSIKKLFARDRANMVAKGREIVLQPLLGAGSLLLQEDDEHMARRKLMLPPFHGERMRAYEEMVREATEQQIAGWRDGEPFALHPGMQAITLEVILRAVFGVSDERRRTELSEALVEVLAMTGSPKIAGYLVPALRRLPVYSRFNSLNKRVDELLAEEIAERRADPDVAEREDILSMLVAARFEDGDAMSDSELRDQLMTLLLAGHETTATGLAWTFDLLMGFPDKFERLKEEVRSGDSTEYLDAVIDESLRVRPVVPFTGRELREPTELAGYQLEPGTTVFASIYMTHTRPDVYEDPYSFKPERFLDGGPETFSWLPFGGGTRRCIGAAFAELEMRVAIRTILRECDLEPGSTIAEQPIRRNVTMSPAGGTIAIARRREPALVAS